jgi:hypothetical protein
MFLKLKFKQINSSMNINSRVLAVVVLMDMHTCKEKHWRMMLVFLTDNESVARNKNGPAY